MTLPLFMFGRVQNADVRNRFSGWHAGARGHDLYLDMLQKLCNDADSFPDMTIAGATATVHAHRFLLRAQLPHLSMWLCPCVVSVLLPFTI